MKLDLSAYISIGNMHAHMQIASILKLACPSGILVAVTLQTVELFCLNIASVVSMLAAALISVFLFCRLAGDPRMILKQLRYTWLCPVGSG